MAPSSSTASTTVQVALRIRPSTAQDATSIPARFQRTIIHAVNQTGVSVDAISSNVPQSGAQLSTASQAISTSKKQTFSFDQVHGPATTQHSLFTSTAKPLIDRFMEGFNCTILAYGQTSSGKTFTMSGIDLDADASDSNNGMGIIPRAVANIFSRARLLKEERGGAWTYNIKGSFIEIYNEDLIDLLALDDATGGRREVEIREDKDGHILWRGLREVNVRNSNEVMTLIRKGTAIRRTNETEMNAQSSRSHAIFSLTLTQKKYTGSTPLPRSSSPLPPGGRSPSRLARPGSLYTNPASGNGARVSSPTFGRPTTPSFVAAMGRGGGLRPASALGHSSETRSSIAEDDTGGWVTIVSKFHFVDLAGSERLKRTAAVGERIKEGISINSGLLALGNVISALGDPSRVKSHTASHVPYRDSKLTRLLQDSLGGNAHTLMIACVSPAEWNVGETVNTLKYANRARNIKNRAVLNEREDGWDDIEWLQGTVTRLRKELKGLKEGSGMSLISEAQPEVLEGAGKKVLAQMMELQNNYEDLREKFVDRTEELTRLRRELGEQRRNSIGGAVGGTGKYEEIVGPVIEEYEKTIAAMEAELKLNRAALRHTNEMVEEKEDELAIVRERHSATDLYVEELKTRVTKLTEREASTEAYIRDIEEKVKAYDETSITSSESLTDLKREISKYKDSESHTSRYIADLEARLARSDESVLALQQTVENLEQESERRREEVEILQSRLQLLKQDGEGWRTDLEEREKRVRELELKMEEWKRKKNEANEDRDRLSVVVGEVVQARKSFDNLELSASNTPSISGISTPNGTLSAESQLVVLQQTHAATLADLSTVTAKYRDALREISDLAAQIQEAKLGTPPVPESPMTDVPSEQSLIRRRMPGSRMKELSEPQYNSAGKRLFFRQAASTESLHTRSLSLSQSLSQELSSARSRKASTSSHGTSSSMSHSPSPSQPHLIPGHLSRHNLSISTADHLKERSLASLENEIMRLQEVLKEREAEITVLEASLIAANAVVSPQQEVNPSVVANGDAVPPPFLSPNTLDHFEDIRKTMMNGHEHVEDSPDRMRSISEPDESLDRLNELMLSMAQKEAHHREAVDSITEQLTQVRRQYDDLSMLSLNQALNMSTEMEALRGKHCDVLQQLDDIREQEASLLEKLLQQESDHAAALDQLRVEHKDALQAKAKEVDVLLTRLNEARQALAEGADMTATLEQVQQEHEESMAKQTKEHETIVQGLREQFDEASTALEKAIQDHEAAFGRLQAEHQQELSLRAKEADDVLARTRQEYEASVTEIQRDHEETLKQKDNEVSTHIQTTEEQYYNALTKLRGDHAKAMEVKAAEFAASLERMREEHASEMRIGEISRECLLSESKSSQVLAIQTLQDEHAAAVARKEAAFTEQFESLSTEHSRTLAAKEQEYRDEMDRLQSENESAMTKLREGSQIEMERLNLALADSRESGDASAKIRKEMEAAMQALQERQASLLQEIERGHEEDVTRLKTCHEALVKELEAKIEKERSTLTQSHSLASAEIAVQHQQAIDELNTKCNATLEALRKEIKEGQRSLAEERAHLAVTLADLERRHSDEKDAILKQHDVLTQELETHKAAAEQSIISQEQDRQMHEQVLSQKANVVEEMQVQMSIVKGERDNLEAEVAKLRRELDKTHGEQSKLIQEASKRESLVDELERHRSVLAELQENLQRVKDEKDSLQLERNRQDALLRDLQAQVARSSSPPESRSGQDRNMHYSRSTAGLSSIKLPPPTPPPSVPPPPAPKGGYAPGVEAGLSISSQASSSIMSPLSAKESAYDSPATSMVPTPITPNGFPAPDPKLTAKVEEQSKRIEEQDAMIKTLNKQLTHCETDLQTHMDLVNTLETSLGDAEKNLRKARMHATEIARERDSLNNQVESLRTELQETKREVATTRKSIVEEKQSLENRLDEERRAKERARAQLDARMDELQKRKSKFACL